MDRRTLWMVLAGMVAGAVLARVFRPQLRRLVARVGRGRMLAIVVLFVLSTLFYSVIYEFGHAAVARALGGEVRSVAWTMFSGDTPHVSYGHMPTGARPWASAGGLLVPIAFALLLGAAWMAVGRRLPWLPAACLLVPAVVLLALHLFCVLPVFTGGGHMRELATHYGLGPLGRALFQMVPAWISAVGLLAIGWQWMRRHRGNDQAPARCRVAAHSEGEDLALGWLRAGWRRLMTLPGRMDALEREVARLQHLAAEPLRRRVREAGVLQSLHDAEFRVNSQFGEDGIIQYLVARAGIGDDERVFVEIGVEDYREANTRYLLERDDWRGLILDCEKRYLDRLTGKPILWQHDLTVACRLVDRDNVNAVLVDHGFEGPIGLFSLDIDGNDYWVWEALTAVEPAIVVVEYNSRFGARHAVSVPYDAGFQRGKAHHSNLYFGASLAALCHLGAAKGYAFVGVNRHGTNAFFVREERLGGLPATTSEEAFVSARVRQARDADGRLTYASAAEDAATIADLPLVDVTSGERVTLAGLG